MKWTALGFVLLLLLFALPAGIGQPNLTADSTTDEVLLAGAITVDPWGGMMEEAALDGAVTVDPWGRTT